VVGDRNTVEFREFLKEYLIMTITDVNRTPTRCYFQYNSWTDLPKFGVSLHSDSA
jgi:hypothetical protein